MARVNASKEGAARAAGEGSAMIREGILVIALGAFATAAAAAGDARTGRRLAEAWCAECHVVGPEVTGISTDGAPPFAWIANNPAKSGSYLRAWLWDPHPPMPRLELGRHEIEHLVSYIESLRKP